MNTGLLMRIPLPTFFDHQRLVFIDGADRANYLASGMKYRDRAISDDHDQHSVRFRINRLE